MTMCALAACGVQDPPSSSMNALALANVQRETTLITGDRVVIRDGKPLVIPGPGRAGVGFSISRANGVAHVIPRDMRSALARGALSPAQFAIADGSPHVAAAAVAAETVDVTIHAIDQGAPAHMFLLVIGSDGTFDVAEIDGTTTISLAAGTTYALQGGFFGSELVLPRFTPLAGAEVTFDSRAAGPIDVDVGDPDLFLVAQNFNYIDHVSGIEGASTGFELFGLGHVGPELPADEVTSSVFLTEFDTPFGEEPTEAYFLARAERGHILHGWQEHVDRGQLANVTARQASGTDHFLQRTAFPLLDEGARGLFGSGFFFLDERQGPFQRLEHYYGDSFVWRRLVVAADENGNSLTLDQDATRFRRGQTVREDWNFAPAGPGFPQIIALVGERGVTVASARRLGDRMTLSPSMTSDGGGHETFDNFTSSRARLLRNGVQIAESADQPSLGDVDVPPGRATYRYEQETTRPSELYPLSDHVRAAWTFRSDSVRGEDPRALPLLAMRFHPSVDDSGVNAERAIVMPISFERPTGGGVPFVLDARLEVSFDDGAHWARVPVVAFGDQALAVIVHPREPALVSLRASATDLDGNRVEQQIDHAYEAKR